MGTWNGIIFSPQPKITYSFSGHELPAELPKHLIPPSKREEDAIYPTLDSWTSL